MVKARRRATPTPPPHVTPAQAGAHRPCRTPESWRSPPRVHRPFPVPPLHVTPAQAGAHRPCRTPEPRRGQPRVHRPFPSPGVVAEVPAVVISWAPTHVVGGESAMGPRLRGGDIWGRGVTLGKN